MSDSDPGKTSFEAAASGGRKSLFSEVVFFLRTHKRWSLIPIFLALGLLGIFVTLTGTGLAPLIYTLF